MDLTDDDEKKEIEQYAKEYRKAGYNVLLTSSETRKGLKELLPF